MVYCCCCWAAASKWYPGEPDIPTSWKLADRSTETRGALFQSPPDLLCLWDSRGLCDVTWPRYWLPSSISSQKRECKTPTKKSKPLCWLRSRTPRFLKFGKFAHSSQAQAAAWARWTTLCHYQGSNPPQYSMIFHLFLRFPPWICDAKPVSIAVHALAHLCRNCEEQWPTTKRCQRNLASELGWLDEIQ